MKVHRHSSSSEIITIISLNFLNVHGGGTLLNPHSNGQRSPILQEVVYA